MLQYCNRTNETIEKMTAPIYSYSSNEIYDARMSQFCVAYLNQNEHSHVINNETTLQRPKCTISPINPLATTIATTTNHDEDFHLPHQAPSIVLSDETFTQKIPSISHLMHDSGISSMLSSSTSNSSSSFILSNSTNHSSPSNSYLNNSSYLNNITSRPTQSYNYLTTTTSTTKSQFQSTPNKSSLSQVISKSKNKCNFHSILDLAQSSQTQTLPPTPLKIAQEQKSTNVTSSFNENLKQMSLALQNKENTLPSSSSTSNANMKRKPRTQITKKQKEILDYAFAMKSYPDAHEVEYLCHLLGFEENVIRVSLLRII
jgi:hypothetical protein